MAPGRRSKSRSAASLLNPHAHSSVSSVRSARTRLRVRLGLITCMLALAPPPPLCTSQLNEHDKEPPQYQSVSQSASQTVSRMCILSYTFPFYSPGRWQSTRLGSNTVRIYITSPRGTCTRVIRRVRRQEMGPPSRFPRFAAHIHSNGK